MSKFLPVIILFKISKLLNVELTRCVKKKNIIQNNIKNIIICVKKYLWSTQQIYDNSFTRNYL